ncbi:MAG: hypothetical protein J7M26_07050 [Armatimonadetes bacterium]|nr:hypothetical protein [Armatimonadota bacterium]
MAVSLLLLALPQGGVASVTIEKVAYAGWPNCYKMSNGIVELIATTDVGPRIIRFGFVGERNEFKEYPDQVGKTGGDEWRIYGGHRLWHSPERKPRSYSPDNSPIQAEVKGDRLILTEPTEPTTHIRKQIIVEMSADQPAVRVVHKLRNEGEWPIELAAWALTVMAPGGKCIIPFPRHDDPAGLLPNRALVLWPYTDCTDARLRLGRWYAIVTQDAQAQTPIKLGVARANEGWMAYAHGRILFVKRYDYAAGAKYPDYGACVETYTNAEMQEVETVGPLTTLDTGEELEHVERWYLLRLPRAVETEEDVDTVVLPLVQQHTR